VDPGPSAARPAGGDARRWQLGLHAVARALPRLWHNPWTAHPLTVDLPFAASRMAPDERSIENSDATINPADLFDLTADWPGRPFQPRLGTSASATAPHDPERGTLACVPAPLLPQGPSRRIYRLSTRDITVVPQPPAGSPANRLRRSAENRRRRHIRSRRQPDPRNPARALCTYGLSADARRQGGTSSCGARRPSNALPGALDRIPLALRGTVLRVPVAARGGVPGRGGRVPARPLGSRSSRDQVSQRGRASPASVTHLSTPMPPSASSLAEMPSTVFSVSDPATVVRSVVQPTRCGGHRWASRALPGAQRPREAPVAPVILAADSACR
jgi:hypothetical protein